MMTKDMETRMINCRNCGEPLTTILTQKNMPAKAQNLSKKDSLKYDRPIDLDICQCTKCGLVQLSNEPVSYYREVIRATSLSEEMTRFRLKQFKTFIKKFHLSKLSSVVEMGCGNGEFLNLLRRAGLQDITGVEYNRESAQYCRELGFEVFEASLDCYCARLYKLCDAFFMFCFLEHLPNPKEILRYIHAKLNNNAVGIIEVPNFDMILKKQLFTEFCADHLLYFTQKTFTAMLENHGFEVISCKSIWHDYILSATVRKRSSLDLSIFETKVNILKKQFAEKIPANARIAIWGAGHQSFATICLADIKPIYIVDSAPFKQGKYSPASHIPIVPPSTLVSDLVDHIIVIAGSYNKEVINIIKDLKINTKIWTIEMNRLIERT